MKKKKIKKKNNFYYKNNNYFCENVNLIDCVKMYGTPLFVYSKKTIVDHVKELRTNLPRSAQIYFAMKSNSNLHLLKLLAKMGIGVDIVSGGELYKALRAGFSSKNIVFSGVGKTEKEIKEALLAKILLFNVESISELKLINKISKKLNIKTNVSLRYNPNIKIKTHPYIATGLKKNKFGLSEDEFNNIIATRSLYKNITVVGISCHIGSQIMSLSPLKDAWVKILGKAEKLSPLISTLDLGGGLGISYKNENEISLKQYALEIKKLFNNSKFHIAIEPGRSIIASAGILITKSLVLKNRKTKNILVLDAAMNDLIRPALYNAFHECIELKQTKDKKSFVDLVGPVCESSDTFITNFKIAAKEGEYYAFLNAGAYGMSMSSQYNARPRAAEVLVSNNEFKCIRKRETYEDLIRSENI